MQPLAEIYRRYIDCLNARDWGGLGQLVDQAVTHNGRRLGLGGYREMLEGNFRDIPDLQFKVALLVAEGSMVASRLNFDCSPKAGFLGLGVNGRRVRFSEHAFYAFEDGRIRKVWSVIDKAAIEAQL